jgi:putative membrane protein
MRKLLMAAAFSVSALALAAQPGYAQSTKQMQTESMNKVSAEQFVTKATNANMFEIQSSQLALEKSKNKDIQHFAQMIIDDHKKAGSELKSVLSDADANVKAPQKLDQEHAKKLDQLKSAAGTDFDKSYVQMQTDGHEQAVELFQSYSQNGDNSALKSWAGKTLPTLEKHLQMFEAIKLPQTTGSL